MYLIKRIVFTLVVSTTLLSCERTNTEQVRIFYGNWAETIAMTKVTELALKDAGIDVKTTLIEPGPIYTALARGECDIFLESWLPQTHAEYWKKYGEQIDKVSTSFDNASTGLVVPSYVTINSIEELNQHKAQFDGRIIGIGSGAGIHKDTEKAIEAYNLDYKQITSSGAAMMASLKKAVMNEEWVVITGWKPHYKWAQYDLKYLKDPKKVYPKEKAYILTRKGFTNERPAFGTFLNNFFFEEEQLYDLMLTFNEIGDDDAAARQWYEENKALIHSWMPEEWQAQLPKE